MDAAKILKRISALSKLNNLDSALWTYVGKPKSGEMIHEQLNRQRISMKNRLEFTVR